METRKRGGEFVWRNYMYNAFERKREMRKRERRWRFTKRRGVTRFTQEWWVLDEWLTRTSQETWRHLHLMPTIVEVHFLYLHQRRSFVFWGISPTDPEGRTRGRTRGRRRNTWKERPCRRKGHVCKTPLSLTDNKIRSPEVLGKRILLENLSFLTCSVRARKKSTWSWKMS